MFTTNITLFLNVTVPGSVTDPKLVRNDGVLLEWHPPIHANGMLTHYTLEWTLNNVTHTNNISLKEDKDIKKFTFKVIFSLKYRSILSNIECFFFNLQFPPMGDDDKLKITLYAVSDIGKGIPVSMHLENLLTVPDEASFDETLRNSDPRLGIAIGVVLSIICVLICAWIILKHRRCVKAHHQSSGGTNGGAGQLQFQARTITERSATATFFPPSPTAVPTNCVVDVHEMQTLIVLPTNENILLKNGQNGILENFGGNNGNGIICNGRTMVTEEQQRMPHANDADESHRNDVNQSNLICSTPKTKYKQMNDLNGNDLQNSKNGSNLTIEENGEAKNVTTTTILSNESIQNLTKNLPLDLQQTHSNDIVQLSPVSTRKINGNLNYRKNSQNSQNSGITSSSLSSLYDSSQQKLLDSVIDSNCSSNSSRCNSRKYNTNSQSNPQLYQQNQANNKNGHSIHDTTEEEYNGKASVIGPIITKVNGIANDVDDEDDDDDEDVADSNGEKMNFIKCSDKLSPMNDINEDSYFQKRLKKWDYRRPIVGPNG